MADKPSQAENSSPAPLLPREPIQRLMRPLVRFLHIESASGVVLLACAVAALVLANSPWEKSFLGFWKTPIGIEIGDFSLKHSLKHWINDGLMAIFFFVIGLEVKREIVLGELRDMRSAALPVAAALGGMIIPAGLYLTLRAGETGQQGWGIPMATDIAFVVGCMAILGPRVPAALRIMLLSLAIVDDIGAILVIAVGYTDAVHWNWLMLGLAGIGLVVVMQRVGVRSMGAYTLIGFAIWLGFHESGIHATIAGVALGLLTPAKPYLGGTVVGEFFARASEFLHGDWEEETHRPEKVLKYQRVTREAISPLEYLIYLLHPWVAFVIMPLFALANAGVLITPADVVSPVGLAVVFGLVVGKPVGILLFSWLSLKLNFGQMPAGVTWRHLLGGAYLAGIGFTMALFIAGLAFSDSQILRSAKVGVLVGSFANAVIGMVILATGPKSSELAEKTESGTTP